MFSQWSSAFIHLAAFPHLFPSVKYKDPVEIFAEVWTRDTVIHHDVKAALHQLCQFDLHYTNEQSLRFIDNYSLTGQIAISPQGLGLCLLSKVYLRCLYCPKRLVSMLWKVAYMGCPTACNTQDPIRNKGALHLSLETWWHPWIFSVLPLRAESKRKPNQPTNPSSWPGIGWW